MNFDQFVGADKTVEPEVGVEIDGTFNCQSCSEVVDEALYDMQRRVLKWSCPEGHVSYIKDFSL